MKALSYFVSFLLLFSSCVAHQPSGGTSYQASGIQQETLITHSLFQDKTASISEEDIQKILNGRFTLPSNLKVAIVKLESPHRRTFYWNDEEYLKTQQAYLDSFTSHLAKTGRITKTTSVPELLLPPSPSFTSIRETAVRMQADVVLVYSINSDVYSRYKIFSKTDIKAFATVQAVLVDVRTGLIPFSSVSTQDYLSQKTDKELDLAETTQRIQKEAVLLAIKDIGQQLNVFLAQKP